MSGVVHNPGTVGGRVGWRKAQYSSTKKGIAQTAGGALGSIVGAPYGPPASLAGGILGEYVGGKVYETAADVSTYIGDIFTDWRPKMKRVIKPTRRNAPKRKLPGRTLVSRKVRRYPKKRIASKKTMRRRLKAAKKVIKSVVKKTLDCSFPTGTYHKSYVGEMYWNNITPNVQVVWGDMMRYKSHTAPYTNGNMSFTPFNGRRLLDALSVVYNNKTKSMDMLNTVNNFDDSKIQADFTYCSYELKITNNSSFAYEVELVMGTAKRDTNEEFRTAWDIAMDEFPWRQGKPNPNTMNIGTAGWNQLNQKWAIKNKKFRLLPGHTKTFFTTYKGCVAFHKHRIPVGETVQLPTMLKGISESWLFIAKPTAGAMFSLTNDQKVLGVVGITQGNQWGQVITCEVKEVYKFLQPESTLDEYEGNAAVFLTDYPMRPDPPPGQTSEWPFWRQNFVDSKNIASGGGQLGLTVNPVYAGGATG